MKIEKELNVNMDTDVFKKVDLRKLCSCILSHEEISSDVTKPYKDQLFEGISLAYEAIKVIADNEDEQIKTIEIIDKAFEIHQEVCMEVGMKLGARLIFKLLHEGDKQDI